MIEWILQEYKDAYCKEISKGLEPEFQDWWEILPGIKEECRKMVKRRIFIRKRW